MANKRPNAAIVYDALISGHRMEVGGQTFVMSEDGDVCVVAFAEINGVRQNGEIHLKAWLDLPGFFSWANNLAEDVIVGCAMFLALNRGGKNHG